MTNELSPYPEYRESGVAWLGNVPAHWEVRRNGWLFAQRNETGFADLPILEVSLRTGVRVRDLTGNGRKQLMADRDAYKRAVAGDVAYNMMRMWQGALGVAPCDGLVSPAYVVARPHAEANASYYAALFRTPNYLREVDTYSRGIVADRNRLYWESFKQIASPWPPLAEQDAIVRYLDAIDRCIRRYIRSKQRLTALLEEQKQLVLHQAVTGGLDPDALLKPSGVDWLGDVPVQWRVLRLRHAAELRVSNVDKLSVAGEQPVRLCNYVDVYKNERVTSALAFMAATATPDEVERFGVRAGDVLITKDSEAWDDIGVPSIVEYEAPDLLCGYHLAILRPRSDVVLGSYLLRALQSQAVATQLHVAANGVTRFGLTQSAIKDVFIAVPPLHEQVHIGEYVDAALRSLRVAVERAHKEIALLREYRTRLVADVVTGKLDVRAAVAGLLNHGNVSDVSGFGDDVLNDNVISGLPDLEPVEV